MPFMYSIYQMRSLIFLYTTLKHLTFYFPNLEQNLTQFHLPREDAGGLSREYVLRIPSVS